VLLIDYLGWSLMLFPFWILLVSLSILWEMQAASGRAG